MAEWLSSARCASVAWVWFPAWTYTTCLSVAMLWQWLTYKIEEDWQQMLSQGKSSSAK